METIGKDGVVTVEEGQGLALESEVVEGFTFDRGFVSAYMVTDTGRMEAVYDKPAIVITDKKISSIAEFLPLLEKLAQAGMTFENVDLQVVGSARKVIVNKDQTTIIEGGGSPTEVAARVKQIQQQIEAASSEYDKENLEKRRASLSGKVAVIKVGGATETEIEEKKFRVDDAVAAVKAALSDGIVPGGGVTLINLTSSIVADKTEDSSVSAGRQLLVKALEQPFRILLMNAGLNADEWLPKVKSAKAGQGVNVNDPSKLVDMKTSGIVDPTRVTKEAVQNAVSIAGTTMTMGALIVEVPKEEKLAAPDMGGGMGMM